MTQTDAAAAPNSFDRLAPRILIAIVAAISLARLLAIFITPLQLDPDEAQYWLWSRSLDWGYASKPPLIAWMIWASTAIGGNSEAWIRLPVVFAHAAAAFALFAAGRRLYGASAGLVAAILYVLMPAVQVSAIFISTDAFLMPFLALALWAYVVMLQTPEAGRRRLAAAGLGAALGFAFLAKYAAIFFVLGLALHAVFDRDARRAWGQWTWAAAMAPLALVFGPNLIWNASHHFAAATHVAEVNAAPTGRRLFNPGKLAEFVLSQFGVFGPIPFAILIAGAISLWRRKRLEPSDRMLLWFALPPILIICVEAFIVRAHSHWAAAAYIEGVVLVAAWLTRWRARWLTIAALAIQGLIAAVLLVGVAAPQLASPIGPARRKVERLSGWDATSRSIMAIARGQEAPGAPLTALVVEDRHFFNELAYYGRADFAAPGAPPLRMRPPFGAALNQAELVSALKPGESGHVLIAELDGKGPITLPLEFREIRPLAKIETPLDRKANRKVYLFVGSDYRGAARGREALRPKPARSQTSH